MLALALALALALVCVCVCCVCVLRVVCVCVCVCVCVSVRVGGGGAGGARPLRGLFDKMIDYGEAFDLGFSQRLPSRRGFEAFGALVFGHCEYDGRFFEVSFCGARRRIVLGLDGTEHLSVINTLKLPNPTFL